MDKEFLNNLFLWLQELYNNTTGGQFGEYDEIETYGDINENGYPEIIKIEKRPIEELYEIVDKPKGTKQEFEDECYDDIPTAYKFLTYEYCDQWRNGGYSGDDYAGHMYYPLPDGKFMKVYYSC